MTPRDPFIYAIIQFLLLLCNVTSDSHAHFNYRAQKHCMENIKFLRFLSPSL